MSLVQSMGNQFRVAANRFRLTPSRVGEKGTVELPDSKAPTEELALSGHIPEDPDAGKFEVRQLPLDRKSQMLLNAKLASDLMLGSLGFAPTFRSMMERADGVAIEIPKKGEKPGRGAEVWLTADGKPLLPKDSSERQAVTDENGTRDRVYDIQVGEVGKAVSKINTPGEANGVLVAFASDGLASAISAKLGKQSQYSSSEVNKAAAELGVPLSLDSEKPVPGKTLGTTLAPEVTNLVEGRLQNDDVKGPLLETVQNHWNEQQDILTVLRGLDPIPGRDEHLYTIEGRRSFEGMAGALKKEVATSLLPDLLAKARK